MAAPHPSEKSLRMDHVYWQEMNYALYYQNKAIVSFIRSEVKEMHRQLINDIYKGRKPRKCNDCKSSEIDLDKESKVWKFRTSCHLECGKWLTCLQTLLSDSVHPDRIYWTNSKVSMWPKSAWECAKIFLPFLSKEKQSLNRGLEFSDSQALMTLLANCKHFHKKLSDRGQKLTHEISTIRNNIYHNCELEISEQEKEIWMEKIITFLKDPCFGSYKECKDAISWIKQIKDNHLHVEFNPKCERIAWRTAVNEISLEYGVKMGETPVTVDSYRQFFKNLCESFRKDDRMISKAPTKGRPKSDRLQQLERQTKCKLDELKRLVYIPTRQEDDAKKRFEENGSIVIKGEMGEGKSTIAYHLMAKQSDGGKKCVVLKCPRDCDEVIKDWEGTVMIDNIFGQLDLDQGYLKEWMTYLPDIEKLVDKGKLQAIFTSRTDILLKADHKLRSFNLFSAVRSLTLSSGDLNDSEKMNILNVYINRHTRDIKENVRNECIANFRGPVGFFQCCVLFASVFWDEGPDFFGSPKKYLLKHLHNLKKIDLLAVAFLFCLGEIQQEHLSREAMPVSSINLLKELALCLSLPTHEIDISLLHSFYDSFLYSYFVEDKSFDIKLEIPVEKIFIRFSHSTIFERVGHVLAEVSPKLVIKYGDSEFLYQKIDTADANVALEENKWFIQKKFHRLLATRMADDILKKGLARTVVNSSAFKQNNVKKELRVELLRDNKFRKFLEDMDENTKGLTMGDMAPIITLILPQQDICEH